MRNLGYSPCPKQHLIPIPLPLSLQFDKDIMCCSQKVKGEGSVGIFSSAAINELLLLALYFPHPPPFSLQPPECRERPGIDGRFGSSSETADECLQRRQVCPMFYFLHCRELFVYKLCFFSTLNTYQVCGDKHQEHVCLVCGLLSIYCPGNEGHFPFSPAQSLMLLPNRNWVKVLLT